MIGHLFTTAAVAYRRRMAKPAGSSSVHRFSSLRWLLALALLMLTTHPSLAADTSTTSTTVYLPLVTTLAPTITVQAIDRSTDPNPTTTTVFLPLVTQQTDGALAQAEEVNAALLGWSLFTFFSTPTFSVTIEKRHFDAGGGGPSGLLQLPILLDLFGYLTIQNYDAFKIWGIQNAQLDRAQLLAKGTGITIAVLDTGVTGFSWELGRRLTTGYDFVDNDPYPSDSGNWRDDDRDGQIDEGVGHGTFVSSIIAATTRDTRIMPVRVLNSDGGGTAEIVARGIRYAADRGAHIINLSLSGPTDEPILRDAIQYASDKGVLIVAAAASNSTTLGYPAAYPSVISVGSINQANTISTFTRTNAAAIAVFAPGEEIYGLSNLGYGVWMTGNSMATAFVAAEAALLLQPNRCTAACVRATLTSQVNPITPAQNERGRIDAYRALQTLPTP
jgi:subtilisin family serine protease